MELNFGGNDLEDIAALVVGLVALSLALQAAIGPTVMLITEAIKSATNITNGKGGVLAIVVGMFIGVSIGLLTAIVSNAETSDYLALAVCGLFAGLFMGAGAVTSFKSSGTINTETSMAVQTMKNIEEEGKATEETNGVNIQRTAPAPIPFRLQAVRTNFPEGATASEAPEDDTLWDYDADEELDSVIQAGPGTDPTLCDCTPNEPKATGEAPKLPTL